MLCVLILFSAYVTSILGGEGCIIGAGGSVIGVGSDIGGSIRMPSYFNGIYGHKPTSGKITFSHVTLYLLSFLL